jgi:hypothetical protein
MGVELRKVTAWHLHTLPEVGVVNQTWRCRLIFLTLVFLWWFVLDPHLTITHQWNLGIQSRKMSWITPAYLTPYSKHSLKAVWAQVSGKSFPLYEFYVDRQKGYVKGKCGNTFQYLQIWVNIWEFMLIYDHLMSTRISTLVLNKIFLWAPKIIKKVGMALVKIW